jgi:hypothetical protein
VKEDVKIPTVAVPNGTLAMIGTAEFTDLYVVNASQKSEIGASTPPNMPGMSLVSGGSCPPFLRAARAKSRFQNGWIASPIKTPSPMPRNERPISCGL